MNDQAWQGVRYLLLMVGSALAARGYFTMEQMTSFVDGLPAVFGAITAAATAVWGFYVTFRTKSVPTQIVVRLQLPTVSPVTGAIVKPEL